MANPFFNAKYYLEKNADVAAVVGDDADLAEQHYFLYGASEALDGNADRSPAPWFDIEFYANSREDLADVPAEQLFLHFVLHGMREGLSPMEGVEFDADTYLAANEDLVEGLNIADPESLTEDEALLLQQHFFAHGYREGRDGGPEIPGYEPDEPDTDLTQLAEALQNLSIANDALDEFLKENGEGNVAASPEDIRDGVGEAERALLEHMKDLGTDTDLAGEVTSAQNGLTAAQAHFKAQNPSTELQIAIRTLRGEQASLERMEAALADQYADAMDDFEAFQKANKGKTLKLDLDNADVGLRGLWDMTDGAVQLAVYIPDPNPAVKGGQVALTAAGKEADYKGITALKDTANAVLSYSIEVEDQRLARDTAEADVQAFKATEEDAVDAFEELLVAEAGLETANKNVADRAKLVQDIADAKALVEQLEALEDDIDAAMEALEDLGYENVIVLESNKIASGDGDIFVFNDVGAKIVGFGEEADDVFFFDVEKYTYNADGVEAGDNNVLEVFLVQEGDDVHVLFEQEAYGSATEEFHTVVLVGTDLDSVQVDDLGFITL